jgi:hypothetical protein
LVADAVKFPEYSGEALMITRDIVQGFLDGHKLGHPKECRDECFKKYLLDHHTYPQSEEVVNKILTDLDSYRN